ncbi:MAG: phospho-sugar mutase [Flavobacteriales bacterium]|nr:phospho-sugar mutase [Flavobacteriales bacterium]MCB9191957.1 phospho-sugar mutase [Flavobacteriales bacterium]MCB9204977.1 phospho-sugar mutase [Flavobacteriales bacterium]
MENIVLQKAKQWTSDSFDAETRASVQSMIDAGSEELTESFYKDLEFGTGGLRGIMGVGTNRINIYTVGMATQGLANYLKKSFEGEIKVAVAHDSRNNSSLFARKTAEVFAANGIKVYLFSELRPTPELSFAIRHYGCKSGVVITASHNPKEYNGYKAYWEDGGQLIAPHDKNVIAEVQKISGPQEVNWNADESLIEVVKDGIDRAYIDGLKSLCLSPEAVKAQSDLNIVFTALHGTGGTMVPRTLKELGFTNISTVAAQDEPNGNFPTVASPNPEEAAALKMALEQAEALGADLVMGTDPDADRVGIAVRNLDGELQLLNGNMTGSLLVYYLVKRWKELGKLDGKQFTAKTIVTSPLIKKISEKNGVPCYDVLTGFKYIAELIKELEGKEQFIGGGEESYGYLAGDLVRDKDAVLSCVLITEMCAWAKTNGKSLFELLIDIHTEFGFYLEDLISVTKKGRLGAEEIAKMMEDLRSNPPKQIAGADVVYLRDYKLGKVTNFQDDSTSETGLPTSSVLQFETSEGTIVTARPSGTEPKIKFYFSVNGEVDASSNYKELKVKLEKKIKTIQSELGLV